MLVDEVVRFGGRLEATLTCCCKKLVRLFPACNITVAIFDSWERSFFDRSRE